jgi:hypothetical protein
MSPRQIQSLMQRFFYGDIASNDGYCHLIRSGVLAKDAVDQLIAEYISGEHVLIYLSAQECAYCTKAEAFSYIERIYSLGRLRLASPDFQGRVLIEPIGVGAGSR